MMRFVPQMTTRTTAFCALFVAGLLAITCFNVAVESHSTDARASGPSDARLAAGRAPVYAVAATALLLGPVTVDRTDDNAAAAACTAAPNDCSLRGAVINANANPGTTINVPAGTYQLTITGNGEQFAATGDLDIRASGTSIVGAGASATIIQQTTNDRILDVNPGTLVVGFVFNLSGVTVTGGNLPTGSGGGMLSGGNGAATTITNCVFDNNKTTGTLAANGGAITDSTTTGSTTLTITDSTFNNNSTATGQGGAIRYNSPGTLTIQRTLFTNNKALSNSGGALNVTFTNPNGSYNISQTAFEGNQANGGASRGGAILVGNGTLNVSYSRFFNNTAGAGVGTAVAQAVGANGSATVNNNWWSRNSGPSASEVFGSFVSNWLQLRLSATPNPILTGGATTLTADIYGNSSGGSVPAANLIGLPPFPDPAATVFANPPPTLGTISGAVTQFVNGQASATYTAGNTGGTDDVTATADNQTVTTNIVINQPPAITCQTDIVTNADPNACTTSVAFNTTATGSPAPTVTCQIVSTAQVITSPHVFPAGTTMVSCTASNGFGADASCTFNVTVNANQSPTVVAPPNVSTTTGAGATTCSAFVSDATLGTATAADTCSGPVTIMRSGVPPGNNFPVGTTTITYTGTDPDGHTGTATQTVTVTDNTPPTVSAPAPSSASADASCQATIPNVVAGSSASDNCTPSGSITLTQSPAAGTSVGLGPHTITVTATDGAGNSSTATTTFTVNDTTPPTIFAPANASYSCASQVPAANAAQASAADNCSTPTVTVSETNNGGAGTPASPLVITRTYTATDGAGNSASATQTITVIDNTAPTVSAPAPTSASANANCLAPIPNVIPGSAASDNCGGAVTLTQSPAAGTLVGAGPHTITVTATDTAGNSASATTTFTVNDTTPPTVTAPAPTSASANASCLAPIPNVVAGSSASDTCGGTVTLTQSPAAGTLVGLGPHTITVTATDAAGNNNTATTTFTVNDTTAPSLTPPPNVSVATSGSSCSAFISDAQLGTASASDNCDGSVTITRTGVPAGNTFPVGTTTITYTATDDFNNTTTRTQTVTVTDGTPPVVTAPPPSSASANSSCQAPIPNVTAGAATDNCGPVTVTQSPTAGTLVGLGPHTITITATDGAGNTSTGTTTFTVNDTTGPVITLNGANPYYVECHTTFVDPGATATDNCSGSVPVVATGVVNSNVPGTYTRTYTATDAKGNTTTTTRTVIVRDSSAPTINVIAQSPELWPPNHKYETFTVASLVTSVTDSCNTSLGVSAVRIAAVTSDELDDDPNGGDGNTTNDIVIANDCKSVQLRAERDGNLDGRVYTITLRVTDAYGNTGTATVKVTVPKSQGNGGAAVDSGPHNTVNGGCP